eukprot:g5537.t1
MILRASLVQPLVALGVPIVFSTLLSWSFTELKRLQSRIEELEATNRDSSEFHERSSVSIKAPENEVSSLKCSTTLMDSHLREHKTSSGERRNEEKSPMEISRQLEEELKRINEKWSVDQERVKVLEKARAAAVKDVMIALASKREAEFELKEFSDKINNLNEELASKNVKIKEMENLLEDEKQQLEALQQQKSVLEEEIQVLKKQSPPSEDSVSNKVNSDLDLNHEVTHLKQQLRLAQKEATSANKYAKSELKLMTQDLIHVRDQKTLLTKKAENLTIQLTKSERTIEDLQNQLDRFQLNSFQSTQERVSDDDLDSGLFSDSFMHEVRAEAALLVEEIEDKAEFDLNHAMKLSQTAEKKALKELMNAEKEKKKTMKLQKLLDTVNQDLNEKQKEIWYLRDKIRVLYQDIEHLTKHHNCQSGTD